jgi:hypothetical protein
MTSPQQIPPIAIPIVSKKNVYPTKSEKIIFENNENLYDQQKVLKAFLELNLGNNFSLKGNRHDKN